MKTVLNGWPKMIYYTMTHHRYYLQFNNQLQSKIVSLKFKNTSLKNFCCRCQVGNKDSQYSFKQNIFNFPNILQYNFIKDEIFEETLSGKNTPKFKDFAMPKRTSSGFFCRSNFPSKESQCLNPLARPLSPNYSLTAI